MSAQILDGAALARELRHTIAQRASHLSTKGITAGLAVILVGDDPASQVYVRNKVKACADAGIRSWLEQMPADSTENAILAVIKLFNDDPAVHGILVQLPLPKGIDQRNILEAIDPYKDVDGLQTHSAGALVTGQAGFVPCTPFGILKMLEHAKAKIAGSEAVVVGRSVSVGKPMGLLLLARDATVTFCHSRTHELGEVTRRADILIAAVGRPAMIKGDMVKPGAIVIDVGINRGADGKLYGDVEIETVRKVASWISPVPGGVGPMTITMLLENTVLAAETALDRS